MLKKYLEKISEVKIELIETKLVDWKVLNLVLFWDEIPKDLVEYKVQFLKEMLDKHNILTEILEEVIGNLEITDDYKKILAKEIFVKIKKNRIFKKSLWCWG